MKINPISLFRIASHILIIVALVHITGHFWLTANASDEEKRLLQLMAEHQKGIVGGTMSMADILHGLNVCYALFFLFAGTLNLVLARNTTDQTLLRKVSAVNVLAFASGAFISLFYFYWLPVFAFGLVALLFSLSGLYLRKR